MALETFANYPQTTVVSGGTTAPSPGTVEVWTVTSSSSFPAASASALPVTQFHVADPGLPTEVIAVTNVSGATWTVTRGAESTTPVAHSPGFTVKQTVSAGVFTGLAQRSRSAAVTVAASNSSAAGIAAADYVCTGTNDDVVINAAIAALPAAGGRVVLLEGAYTCPNPIIVDQSYVELRGQGNGFATQINVPAGTMNRTAAIIVGNTGVVNQCAVRDLGMNVSGGGSVPNPGTGHGIVVAGDGCLLQNVLVRYCSGDAFHYAQDLLNTGTQTTISSASNGASLPQSTINVASTTGFASSGSATVRKTTGAFAQFFYSAVTGTSFTGCSSNFPGASFTLATGDVVVPNSAQFDNTTINCYALNYGGSGYFVDPNYSSCEWLFCRADGSGTKPTGTGTTQNGFLLYGGELKFVDCHAYFNAGQGMKIGDTNAFSANNINVLGGEWESNTWAGIRVINNLGPVSIGGGANFYGQGTSTSLGADIYLDSPSTDARISDCVFTAINSPTAPSQIYAAGSTYGSVTGCVFKYSAAIDNIFLDGPAGAVSGFTISGNRFANTNAGSTAVLLKGATTACTVTGNITDAPITELVSGSTPDFNLISQNTLVSGYGAAVTIVGAHSHGWDAAASSAPSPVSISANTETVIASAAISAGLQAGACYRITAWGTFSETTSGSAQGQLRLTNVSGTVIATVGTGALGASTSGSWRIVAEMMVATAGSSGSWAATIGQMISDPSTGAIGTGSGTVTVDTTAAQVLVLTADFFSADASGSCKGAIVEKIV